MYLFVILATDRRCPPASYVGLIRARRTNRDPIARAAHPLGMFACLALSRPYLTDLVLRGTTLGSHFTLFRLSLNNAVRCMNSSTTIFVLQDLAKRTRQRHGKWHGSKIVLATFHSPHDIEPGS